MRLLDLEIKPEFEALLDLRRYTDTLFVVQPWPEIYVQDRWRKADFAKASRLFEPTVAAYAEGAYGMRIVPRVSVEERVAFVLQHTGVRFRPARDAYASDHSPQNLRRFNFNKLLCPSFGLNTGDAVEGSKLRLTLRLIVAAGV